MEADDVGYYLDVFPGQTEYVRVFHQILTVLVMSRSTNIGTHIVEDSGNLEKQPALGFQLEVLFQVIEYSEGHSGNLAGMFFIIMVFATQAYRRGLYLIDEFLPDNMSLMKGVAQEGSFPDADGWNNQLLCGSSLQEFTVENQAGDKQFCCGVGDLKRIHDLFYAQGGNPVYETVEIRLLHDGVVLIFLFADLAGSHPGISTHCNEMLDPLEFKLPVQMVFEGLHAFGNVPGHVFPVPQGCYDLLLGSYGPDFQGMGGNHMVSLKQHQFSAAAADFHDKRVGAADLCAYGGKGVLNGDIGESVLLYAVGDGNHYACLDRHPVDKGVPVGCFPHRRGGDCFDILRSYTPPLEDFHKALENSYGLAEAFCAYTAGGKGITTKGNGFSRGFHDPPVVVLIDFRDQHSDCGGSDVDDSHQTVIHLSLNSKAARAADPTSAASSPSSAAMTRTSSISPGRLWARRDFTVCLIKGAPSFSTSPPPRMMASGFRRFTQFASPIPRYWAPLFIRSLVTGSRFLRAFAKTPLL